MNQQELVCYLNCNSLVLVFGQRHGAPPEASGRRPCCRHRVCGRRYTTVRLYGRRYSPDAVMVSIGTPARQIRVSDELWEAFGKACSDQGTSRAEALRAFMVWYLGRTDELPEREAGYHSE